MPPPYPPYPKSAFLWISLIFYTSIGNRSFQPATHKQKTHDQRCRKTCQLYFCMVPRNTLANQRKSGKVNLFIKHTPPSSNKMRLRYCVSHIFECLIMGLRLRLHISQTRWNIWRVRFLLSNYLKQIAHNESRIQIAWPGPQGSLEP